MCLVLLANRATNVHAQPAGGDFVRLGHWRLNTADWRGDHGQVPVEAAGVAAEPGVDGLAAAFPDTAQRALLRYRAVEANGSTNVSLDTGSIRFLFQPNWTKRSPMAPPGASQNLPGHWARLLEIGRPGRSPWLALSINPEATRLVLQTADATGQTLTNTQAPITWIGAMGWPTPWHEIVVLYSPAHSGLVVDGNYQQDPITKAYGGAGVARAPADGREFSLALGGSLNGEFPAGGRIAEMETFAEQITPLENYTLLRNRALTATVQAAPPAVTLRWFNESSEETVIRRRIADGTDWVTVNSRVQTDSFTDADPALQPGRTYEYQVTQVGTAERTMFVALNATPVAHRGRLILLVDKTLAPKLKLPLELLRSDLVGDGWTVIRHDVPRQSEGTWNNGPVNRTWIADVAKVKALVQADYAAAPADTKAVLILGHVVVPYSGLWSEDGHGDHTGAWPADSYYGDMDGQWSDRVVSTGARVVNVVWRNLPGDGKFDPNNFVTDITGPAGASTNGVELAVGRVDFADLPAFQSQTEAGLLARYLEKDHRFRHKQLTFARPAAVAAYFYTPYNFESRIIYDNAAWTLSRMFGDLMRAVGHDDCFATATPCLWGMQGGYGGPDAINCSPDANRAQGIAVHKTELLALADQEPRVGFYLLKGSYFGDWNLSNNLLRACLATRNYGLASVWTREDLWRFESLGVGDTLGSGVVRTARGRASTRTTALMGDPTLRAWITAPPSRLTGRRTGDGVSLSWIASPDAQSGYFVYRSANDMEGPFAPVNPTPVNGLSFVDTAAPAGEALYSVRAAQLVTTGSGAFTNLSQAIFLSVK
jgi:hypothetical protein